MDIDALKGKTIDDKLHADLVAHVADLAAQRDAARKESIDGRKGKDAKLKEQADRIAAMAERLGIDPDADLASLPDVKGQAEAAKQFEAKLTRAQRELADKSKAYDELSSRYASERRDRAIAEQVGKHPFIDSGDVSALVAARLHQEGDDLLIKADGDKLVPLADGVAWIAKTKPHLVRPAGGGQGSGFGAGGAAGGGAPKTMTRAEFDAASQAQRLDFFKAGGRVADAAA